MLFATSVVTGSLVNIAGVVLMTSFSYFYSAPPLRLKTRPPLDSISNAFIYLIGPSLMGFGFSGSFSTYPVEAVWLGLAAAAFHAYTTVMDVEHDRKAGDRTFAVVFGARRTVILSSITFLFVFMFAPIHLKIVRLNLALASLMMLMSSVDPEPGRTEWISKLIFVLGMFSILGVFTRLG